MGFRLAWLVCVLLTLASAGMRGAEAKWLKASAPDVTILTSLSRDDALRRVREFQQYVAALRAYLGEPSVPLPPLRVVVFRDFRDFQRYRPLLKNGKPQRVGGYFSSHGSWAIIGVPASLSDSEQRAIYHEGVHWFMSGSAQTTPAWLEEGMAEVFSTFHIDGAHVYWGTPIRDHLRLLREHDAPPLDHVLATPREELFKDTDHTGRFYAESWAFVHFLVFGQNGLPANALANFRKKLTDGATADAAFAEAFGHTCAEMDHLLQRYIDDGSYHVPVRPLIHVPRVQLEPATSAEVDETLGRLALVAKRYDLALQHGRRIIARAPTDARGHALVGITLKEEGASAAVDELKLAVNFGTTDFQPYFEVACAAQNAAVDGADMTPAQARYVVDLYEQAIALYPQFDATYDNLAGLVAFLGNATAADRAALKAGARRFPNDPMISLGIAQCLRQSGEFADARALLATVLTRSGDAASDASRFGRQLQQGWDNEDLFNQVSSLMKAQRFEQALGLLNGYHPETPDPAVQQQIQFLRPEIEAAVATQQMNAAVERQHWAEARRLIGRIVASDAPPVMKSEARRVLADLDRRQLTQDQ